MIYEVFIPSIDADGYDVTLTVEADNWMSALKTGLAKTGEAEDLIRNVMCDIKQDNSIHVTDASTRRVFVLKEVDPDAPTKEEPEQAPTQRIDISNAPKAPVTPAQPAQTFDRVPTDLSHQIARDGGARKTEPVESPLAQTPEPQVVVEEPKVVVEEPKVVVEEPKVVVEEPQPQLAEVSETHAAAEARMRIGSSTMQALQREQPQAKVLEEKRFSTGERPAVKL